MNRKNIPLLLMLPAGAVTFIITFIQKYDMVEKLAILLAVLVLFYLLGSILVWTLDYFDRQNEEKRKEEGEVIEKEAGETEGSREDQEDQEDQEIPEAQESREDQESQASDEEEG